MMAMDFMEFYAVYDRETGTFLWRGTGAPGTSKDQKREPDQGIIVMPYEAYMGLDPNPDLFTLEPLKQAVVNLMNQKAGEFRKNFITDIFGQDGAYERKGLQAIAFLAATNPDPESAAYLYLKREAVMTDRPIADVAHDIAANYTQWIRRDADIEGKRAAARNEIQQAGNIADIVAAAMFDWNDALKA